MAETGAYYLEGKGTVRTFLGMDDLIFLPSQIDTFPLGVEIEVQSKVILGKSAEQSVFLQTPILNAAKILELRNLTGGKPVSLKFVGGHLKNDLEAVFNQENIPDVLVIDGDE